MADKRTESSEGRADADRQVRMAVKRFDISELDQETWDFLCECGSEQCQEWVTLHVAEYEALQRSDTPILAPGHTFSPGRRTRRKARRLVDDAKALKAQAEHQVKRAKQDLTKKRSS